MILRCIKGQELVFMSISTYEDWYRKETWILEISMNFWIPEYWRNSMKKTRCFQFIDKLSKILDYRLVILDSQVSLSLMALNASIERTEKKVNRSFKWYLIEIEFSVKMAWHENYDSLITGWETKKVLLVSFMDI
jgi:hypothetical protein